MRSIRALAVIAVAALAAPAAAGADVVTDWNRTLVGALEVGPTAPPPAARIAAIVQASVFDAVNGIRPRYAPYHVAPAAPRGASRAAAVASAAHEALVALFPAQQAALDDRLTASLAQIAASGRDGPAAIAAGVAWGKTVADQLVAWRATDGFAATLPPYVARGVPGAWQPTPPLFGPPLFRQFATMTPFALTSAAPFALTSAAQFLPGPPPALTSRRYARDFNEVKALGSATSALRTPYETQTATFWQSDSPAAMWNRVADALADEHHQRLVDNARLLALMNIALADATIAIWNAKTVYDTWRPITAIAQAASDGNPRTAPDTAWTPLLPTPAFQEYPAGHPGVSNAAASVLASAYGDCTAFTVTSATQPGVERAFTSFSDAVAQVEDARVLAGIHFRFAVTTAARMGADVADYVESAVLRPLD